VRAAGLLSARVTVTPDELRSIQEALERLLEPLLARAADDVPAEAARVRIKAVSISKSAPSG
jgi:hypothetical protein